MYCTLEDLKKQLPEEKIAHLTDDEMKKEKEINQERVDEAIMDASSEIDTYAQIRYPVPFSPVPDIIKKLAVDITLYNLFSRRGFKEISADSVIVTRYKAAIKLLENLAKGVVAIGVTTPQPDTEILFTSNKRLFNRESLKGY